MRCRSGDGCARAAVDGRFCEKHAAEMAAIRQSFKDDELARKTRRGRKASVRRCKSFECGLGIMPGSDFCRQHQRAVVTDGD